MYLVPNPIFLDLGFVQIRWYAVCIVTGLLVAFFIAYRRLAKKGYDPEILYDYAIVGLPLATVLARAYYVIFRWSYYSQVPSEIIKIWNGGLAIHGGLLGILLTVIIVSRHHGVNVLDILDVIAPCVLIGQAIGRWGNYFNSEAYGSVTDLPWAINVIDDSLGSVMVHPTFLYESIWCLLGALLIFFVVEKKWQKNRGELFCFYMMYYSFGRFFIEALRTDSLMFFGLKTAQIVSLALFAAGLAGIIYLRKRGKKNAAGND